jgi:glycosyltransferase involved in cell wall biosynthesis
MSNDLAIGVITYNSAKYITETLESIDSQTFKKFDLLISDDASSDDTLAVIKQFLKEKKIKAKVFKQKKNLGITKNCNFLIKKIVNKYKFFALSAADDLMHKKRLEIGYKILNKNKNIFFLFSDCRWFVKNKFLGIRHFLFQKVPKTKSDLVEDFTVPTPTIMYNSKYFPKTGFDKKFKNLSDFVMVFNLWKDTKYYFVDKVLIYYRRHANSVMLSNKIYKERLLLEKFFKKKKINKKYPHSFEKFIQLKLYSKFSYHIKSKSRISTDEFLKFILSPPHTIKWIIRKLIIICRLVSFFVCKASILSKLFKKSER